MNSTYDGHWYDPMYSGQGIDLRFWDTPGGLAVFIMVYAPLDAVQQTVAWTGQALLSDADAGNGSYVFDLAARTGLGLPLERVGRMQLFPQPDGSLTGGFSIPNVNLHAQDRTFVKLLGVPVKPGEPGNPGLPPITSASFSGRVDNWPGFPFGNVTGTLSTSVVDGHATVGAVSWAFVANGDLQAGTFYQNPDYGQMCQWFSEMPLSRDLLDADNRACRGWKLAWAFPGGSPQTDRFPLIQGRTYYLNQAFIDPQAWKEGRIVPLSLSGTLRTSQNAD